MFVIFYIQQRTAHASRPIIKLKNYPREIKVGKRLEYILKKMIPIWTIHI